MSWIVHSWYVLLPPPWAHLALVAISILSGLIVGMERERAEKPAGLRTIGLIGLGACLFTMASRAFGAATDPTRIAAQIVTGVGFLGAGVILHRPSNVVRGITTAATIWAVAAVGVVAGAGYAIPALGAAVLVLVVLVGGHELETRFLGACRMTQAFVTFAADSGKGRPSIDGLLDDYEVPGADRKWAKVSDDLETLQFAYCDGHLHHRAVVSKLADSRFVRSLETERRPPAKRSP